MGAADLEAALRLYEQGLINEREFETLRHQAINDRSHREMPFTPVVQTTWQQAAYLDFYGRLSPSERKRFNRLQFRILVVVFLLFVAGIVIFMNV